MRNILKPTKDRQDEVLSQLTDIAHKIKCAMGNAERTKSTRCLVELESASVMVAELIKQISSGSRRKHVNWTSLVDAIAFISKIVDKFNAFLIYQLDWLGINEDRLADKATSSSGGYFANFSRF